MKRIAPLLTAAVAVTLLVSGCGTVSGSSDLDPVDLTDADVIAALCGDDAAEVQAFVASAADANPQSGKRNALTGWGIDDPKDDEYLVDLQATLAERAEEDCEADAETAGAMDGDNVGVEDADGTIRQLPLYSGNGSPVVFDSTQDPNTPPLLDVSLKYQDITQTWADLVERVGNQQWFIDGVNARAPMTGFDWEDVKRFAATDGVEARVIQVSNWPGITDDEVRDHVRSYIGDDADSLHIVRIGTFINTVNVGTKDDPRMGDYVDTQQMIRVSLTPIVYNDKGEPVALDISRGAGIFIDCANLHWVPKTTWECPDAACEPPPPPCTENCSPPPCPPGNEKPECAPKSNDPGDYVYPPGKPPVPPVTTPPDVVPPPVNTQQPGGGGIVDTPTNDPGTETGVTAPGADPAPTTPSTPPPNEGGDNGPGDPGGF